MTLQTLDEAAKECEAIESAAGFDRVKAEWAVREVMRSLGMGTDYIPSCEPGVVAYAYDDDRTINVDRIRTALEERGYRIASIDESGWTDGWGGDALAVAFDVSCLDAEWRNQTPALTC